MLLFMNHISLRADLAECHGLVWLIRSARENQSFQVLDFLF